MTHPTLNATRFTAQLRAYGIYLTSSQVDAAIDTVTRDWNGSVTTDEVKRQSWVLGAYLSTLGMNCKHLKRLEALARLHGARSMNAVQKASAPSTQPALPLLDVMMGVQGLTADQAKRAEAYLERRIQADLIAHEVPHWTYQITPDPTPSEVVRRLATGLSLDTPDDEVSDYVDYILPETFQGWGPEQLQGDVMQAILDARAFAKASSTS